MVLLFAFSSYFWFREATALSDLRALIEPVPNITDVSYVPTSAEVAGISAFVATLPIEGRMGTSQRDRESAPEASEERRPDYWIITTSLPPDSVVEFYSPERLRGGWVTEISSPPYISLVRGKDRMLIFASDNFPRVGSKVLYTLGAG